MCMYQAGAGAGVAAMVVSAAVDGVVAAGVGVSGVAAVVPPSAGAIASLAGWAPPSAEPVASLAGLVAPSTGVSGPAALSVPLLASVVLADVLIWVITVVTFEGWRAVFASPSFWDVWPLIIGLTKTSVCFSPSVFSEIVMLISVILKETQIRSGIVNVNLIKGFWGCEVC